MSALRVVFAAALVLCVLGAEEMPPTAEDIIGDCLVDSCDMKKVVGCLEGKKMYMDMEEGKMMLDSAIDMVNSPKYHCAALVKENADGCYLQALYMETNKLRKLNNEKLCMEIDFIVNQLADLKEVCPMQKKMTHMEYKKAMEIQKNC